MPNRLQYETSPYLLQHAHNPVDWHAWGEEAFRIAKEQNKPILLSIGYATCHWCHVMERESFEDERVAAFMNQHFVNIKVDREERPDVDAIYMEVIQVMSGNGGWPLNCFLLPDRRAFFAGTYFPPRNAHGRASWSQVLANIHAAFTHRRDEVEEQAATIMDYLQKSTRVFARSADFGSDQLHEDDAFTPELRENIFATLAAKFDRTEGGFGAAPKFPSTMALQYCLDYARTGGSRADEAREHLRLSLQKMSLGGIYDHVGGGYARYSVDSEWFAPHFEKMLYDNALLLYLLADAYATDAQPLYLRRIRQTLDWLQREMRQPQGGYSSARDADSEGEEGKYYVWTLEEIQQALPAPLAALCVDYYGVTAHGNWEEGKNILFAKQSAEDYARARQIDSTQLLVDLHAIQQHLHAKRSERIAPIIDDKVLLDWNALLVRALARVAQVVGDEAAANEAGELLDFLLRSFRAEGDGLAMLHSYKAGAGAKIAAFLDDYAFLIDALLSVYALTFEAKYLRLAEQYAAYAVEQFWDERESLFFLTPRDAHGELVLRPKDLYDNATPSGNAVMADVLQRLGRMCERADFADVADRLLLAMSGAVAKFAQSFARYGTAALWRSLPSWEVAVVGADYREVARALQARLPLGAVLVAAAEDDGSSALLAHRTPQEAGQTLIYICRNFACQQPTASIETALALIGG